jgi:hypothetical protein
VRNGLGGVAAVGKTRATDDQQGTDDMAADHVNPKAGEMDYPAHERNYSGFIKLLKIATVITAIVGAVVILIIANK